MVTELRAQPRRALQGLELARLRLTIALTAGCRRWRTTPT